MQAFLVALAMEILKYYGPKLGEAAKKIYELDKELKENKKKAEDYQRVVDSPAGREERRRSEDASLN